MTERVSFAVAGSLFPNLTWSTFLDTRRENGNGGTENSHVWTGFSIEPPQ